MMNTLALRPSGEFCTDRVVHACLMFVGAATELSHTYKLLKPHLDFLLFQAVFPELCLSEEDVQVISVYWRRANEYIVVYFIQYDLFTLNLFHTVSFFLYFPHLQDFRGRPSRVYPQA